MTFDQTFLLFLLLAVLVLFVWGRWRYDVVAFGALLAATLAGTVPFAEMFSGFGHPATVTVALVLIVSRGLQNSGAIQSIGKLIPSDGSTSRHVGVLAAIGGALSAVMNNVGALALLMPAALQSAAKAARSPALLLMPLSFGSILGGLVTLIGTPPNIIIATYRGDTTGEPFGMFDFTPVGGAAAVAGILFVALVGWRLVPELRRAKMSARELFEIESYLSEAVVEAKSPLVGKTLSEADDLAEEQDAILLPGRGTGRHPAGPDPRRPPHRAWPPQGGGAGRRRAGPGNRAGRAVGGAYGAASAPGGFGQETPEGSRPAQDGKRRDLADRGGGAAEVGNHRPHT
jgi:di/tricarboxylate transporter